MDLLLSLTSRIIEQGSKYIEASQLVHAPVSNHFSMHSRQQSPDLKMARQIDHLISDHRVRLLIMQVVDLLGEHVVKELVVLQILPP